jgi:hypothetical protein
MIGEHLCHGISSRYQGIPLRDWHVAPPRCRNAVPARLIWQSAESGGYLVTRSTHTDRRRSPTVADARVLSIRLMVPRLQNSRRASFLKDLSQRWPELNAAEINEAHESSDSLAALIARRYRISPSEALRQLQEWYSGRNTEPLSPRDQSRLDGEDAGRGDPRQDEPSVG